MCALSNKYPPHELESESDIFQDSIAVSVFAVILIKFEKYYQKQIQISTDGETSWLVYIFL